MARRDLSTPRGTTLPQHPVYLQWEPVWRKLLDVAEGSGGFLDPKKPYLVAHPREWEDHTTGLDANGNVVSEGAIKFRTNPSPTRPTPKLTARRRMARYENVASTLIDQLRSALFRKPPQRTFLDPDTVDDTNPLKAFWENADGLGRDMDAVMQEVWTGAAVFGHAILLADRDGETPEGSTPSQADTPPVVIRSYTPLDMPDWLVDGAGRLTAVRLLEAAPRENFEDVMLSTGYQVREVDDTNWSVTLVETSRGNRMKRQVEETKKDAHGFGTLPVVLLYTKRRALTPLIGRSILGDPQSYIDIYNLVSEVRELLRNQTFAILNVPIGDRTGGVQSEMALVGQSAGTQNVLFSTNPSAYISPEGSNVEAYHEHIDRLIRTIYRMAVVAWEGDSKDVESAESRMLKKEDLHQMLAAYASECEDTEMQIAKLVYRAHFGESWETQWDKDEPSIAYPDKFDVTSLTEMLENATAALALELGETATKELKKSVATKLLDGASQPTIEKIQEEIDAMEVKTLAEQEQEAMDSQFEHDAEVMDKQFEHDEEMAKKKPA